MSHKNQKTIARVSELEGFERECKELNERLKETSVKHQEALKNKSKELYEIEIRLKEEISQLNETNEQYEQKINIINEENKIDHDIHNKTTPFTQRLKKYTRILKPLKKKMSYEDQIKVGT